MIKFFLPALLFSLGIVFLVLGIKMLYDIYKFKQTAIKTLATVIEIKNSTGKNNVKTYSPVLSFKTTDGAAYIYDVSSYYPTHYTIGQQIEVVYPKEDPARVKVNTFRHNFLPPVILILLGLIGIGLSAWLFLKK